MRFSSVDDLILNKKASIEKQISQILRNWEKFEKRKNPSEGEYN